MFCNFISSFDRRTAAFRIDLGGNVNNTAGLIRNRTIHLVSESSCNFSSTNGMTIGFNRLSEKPYRFKYIFDVYYNSSSSYAFKCCRITFAGDRPVLYTTTNPKNKPQKHVHRFAGARDDRMIWRLLSRRFVRRFARFENLMRDRVLAIIHGGFSPLHCCQT